MLMMNMNGSGLVFENEDQTKDPVVGNCFGLISHTILFAGQAFRSQA